MAKILCIDFDGVLHSYTSGWQGADKIPDDPVDGAIDWLLDIAASEVFEAHIFSSRSHQEGGRDAMRDWLVKHGVPADYFHIGVEGTPPPMIWMPTTKPPAFLSIDDRGMRFEGTFPTIPEMAKIKTWQGR